MASGTLNGLVNLADITISSQILGTAPDFAVVLGANKYAAVDCVLYFALPANHGGLQINWLVPARMDTGAWPLAKIRDNWTVCDVASDPQPRHVLCVAINDATRTDAAMIVPPGPDARLLCVRGSCLFKAPAAGGTVNLQAALVGPGANVTVLANSQVEYRVY